jgi:hypothetical protein
MQAKKVKSREPRPPRELLDAHAMGLAPFYGCKQRSNPDDRNRKGS